MARVQFSFAQERILTVGYMSCSAHQIVAFALLKKVDFFNRTKIGKMVTITLVSLVLLLWTMRVPWVWSALCGIINGIYLS